MVKRYNGRISHILKTHHFDSSLDMERTLKHYVYLYNYHFHQDSLGCIAPREPRKTYKGWGFDG